uniref:receptor protein-tyrosine kinase n=1 Tax=Ciona intestinalis TaxID=7719 RepID=F6ZB89_CIOIN
MFFLFIVFYCISIVTGEIHVLYNTKVATSDLDWALHPTYGAWEELSGLDVDGNTIRYHQVCNTGMDEQDNWVRSPFIDAKSAQRIYMDIEFSVMKCEECRETFALYYYPSSSDTATTTFPPWRENPYIKIDTLAAGERFDSETVGAEGINKKTLVIGPLSRRGFYIAAQDQGACMSIMSLKLYYYHCEETTHNLAYFPNTISGGGIAELVSQSGKCVSNSVYANEVPKYRCNIYGEWQVPTGSCQCRAGYEPNTQLTACTGCMVGKYKSTNGNTPCQVCPQHSVTHSTSASHCTCVAGHYRAENDPISQACTRPPTKPRNVTHVQNKTSLLLSWVPPSTTGGRTDIYYSISCELCDSEHENCQPCNVDVQYRPSNHQHTTTTYMEVSNLNPFSCYKFKVSSSNGVSRVSVEPEQFELIKICTNAAAPSAVTGLKFIWIGEVSATLSWLPPTHSNKIVGYEVQLFQNNQRLKLTKIMEVSTPNVTINGLNPGWKYVVMVRACNNDGCGQFSEKLQLVTYDKGSEPESIVEGSTTWIGGVIGGVLVIVIIIIVVMIKRRQTDKKKRKEIQARTKLNENTQQLNQSSFLQTAGRTYVDYRDPHNGVKEIATEIDQTRIKIDSVIGRGEFGEVCRGKMLTGKTTTSVAVKRLKHGASLIDHTNFLREACTMAQFKDPNIIQLKGVVTKSIPAMIITEFMEHGSLDKFLQARSGQLTVLQLLEMLRGIASGMKYLSSMKYVHRDLAARNILVNSQLVCKVSDFGLSRTLENDPQATYTTQGGKIALRWTAPESIRCRQFTSASDVWSYGIVMWEVMSYGEKPYWDMSNEVVTEVLEDGYRLPSPEGCPTPVHSLMLKCWSYEPKRRPTLLEIIKTLDHFIKQPSSLQDDMEADASAPLLKPDSPNSIQDVSTLDEWLDMVKLGRYRRSFHNNGINDLESLAHISESELDRLGIASPSHRTRLQGGINTLRQHLVEVNEVQSSSNAPYDAHASTLPIAHGKPSNPVAV